MSLESVVWIIARATLGLLLSAGISAAVWVLSRYFPQDALAASTGFLITQSLIVATPAGICAVAAWWNPDSPLSARLFAAALVPGAAFLVSWLTIEIRGVETYNALFAGTHRLPVIATGDLLGVLIITATLSANIAAGALYIYRLLRHNEL